VVDVDCSLHYARAVFVLFAVVHDSFNPNDELFESEWGLVLLGSQVGHVGVNFSFKKKIHYFSLWRGFGFWGFWGFGASATTSA